jgi:hypothetical protein
VTITSAGKYKYIWRNFFSDFANFFTGIPSSFNNPKVNLQETVSDFSEK